MGFTKDASNDKEQANEFVNGEPTVTFQWGKEFQKYFGIIDQTQNSDTSAVCMWIS